MAGFAHYAVNLTGRGTALHTQPHIVTRVYNGFLLDNNLPNTESIRLTFSLYHLANEMEPGTVHVVDRNLGGGIVQCLLGDPVCYAPDNGHLTEVAADNPTNDNYQGVSGSNGRAIFHYMENGERWLFDLCVAASMYRLQPANIRSYFGMHHIIIDDSGHLRDAIYFVMSTNAAIFRGAINAIIDTDWGRYRASLSSNHSCFMTSVTAYGRATMERVLGGPQFAALEALVAAPWDENLQAAINDISLGVIAVSLDVARVLPAAWITGRRVINNMPRVTNLRLTRLFIKLSDLQANTANIDNAVTEEAAFAAAGY